MGRMDSKLDSAIIGYTINRAPVYDYDVLVCLLESLYGLEPYASAAWIDHNYIGVPDAPIIIHRLEG